MSRIRKCFDPVEVRNAPHCSDVEEVFELKRDEHCNKVYRKRAEKNVREYIQSFAKGCSLKSMLERCALMPPDQKYLYMQVNSCGVSMDLSAMPKDLTSAFELLKNTDKAFPGLMKRVQDGESLEDVLKSFVPEADKKIEEVNKDVQN